MRSKFKLKSYLWLSCQRILAIVVVTIYSIYDDSQTDTALKQHCGTFYCILTKPNLKVSDVKKKLKTDRNNQITNVD